MKYIIVLLLAINTAVAQGVDRQQFCAGFEQGYKSIKGSFAYVPFCPYTPAGVSYAVTPFQLGIQAGIKKASK